MEKKHLLTAKEAAKMLGRDRDTLRRWKNEHRGPPALRIGKRFYYAREVIEQWLKSLSLAS